MCLMTFPEFLEKKYLEWQLKEEGRKTLVQFAAYIGVSQPILSMWLSGKKRPGVGNIKLLADIFGYEVYDALEKDRPNPYLQRINRVWEFLPEEIQQRIAEEAETYETTEETDRVEKAHQRRKKSKAK